MKFAVCVRRNFQTHKIEYVIAAGCSVTAMFTSGFPVGILVGAVLCIYCALSCRKRGYKPVYVK